MVFRNSIWFLTYRVQPSDSGDRQLYERCKTQLAIRTAHDGCLVCVENLMLVKDNFKQVLNEQVYVRSGRSWSGTGSIFLSYPLAFIFFVVIKRSVHRLIPIPPFQLNDSQKLSGFICISCATLNKPKEKSKWTIQRHWQLGHTRHKMKTKNITQRRKLMHVHHGSDEKPEGEPMCS